ncbi:1074_t:CDS:2 [Racocetra persica]|uniref:1074_t:CDS:1 n=1 Tax=Racocetra persica TaxID=160502 RepID=A0ACA9PM52_9GLOM|nr:1074_t:CDS:2 [Racocetra persica]
MVTKAVVAEVAKIQEKEKQKDKEQSLSPSTSSSRSRYESINDESSISSGSKKSSNNNDRKLDEIKVLIDGEKLSEQRPNPNSIWKSQKQDIYKKLILSITKELLFYKHYASKIEKILKQYHKSQK